MFLKKKKEIEKKEEVIKTYKKYDYFWKTYCYDDMLALYYYTSDSNKSKQYTTSSFWLYWICEFKLVC